MSIFIPNGGVILDNDWVVFPKAFRRDHFTTLRAILRLNSEAQVFIAKRVNGRQSGQMWQLDVDGNVASTIIRCEQEEFIRKHMKGKGWFYHCTGDVILEVRPEDLPDPKVTEFMDHLLEGVIKGTAA